MAIVTMVMGFSGEGLTYSLKDFDPQIVGVFSPTNKPMPFKGGQNIRRKVLDDITKLADAMLRSHAPVIVIDDFDFFITLKQLKAAKSNLKGDAVFNFLRSLAYDVWAVIDTAINKLDAHRRVYILTHAEEDNERVKMKSLGKVFENMISPEGLCTTVLQSKIEDDGYYFMTQNNGQNAVKSPEGMFSSLLIPNDLNAVDDAICDYYGLTKQGLQHEAVKADLDTQPAF